MDFTIAIGEEMLAAASSGMPLIDTVIAVGERSEKIAEGASGREPQVAYFKNKEDFLRDIDRFVSNGDIILVKGSRGMKMELVVERLKEF